MPKKCVCGHENVAHQHYRNGSDCTACGEQVCARFVADTVIGRLFGALTGQHEHRPMTVRGSEPVEVRRGAA